jgi:hypothetical protein
MLFDLASRGGGSDEESNVWWKKVVCGLTCKREGRASGKKVGR